ncbi:hypothetical protein HK100_004651 [Physocladia obscura]|uniref:Uncharacterized protein n=1 Tax=Physocladia obscura TaxID=109957 RepID=A0AAD5T6Y6_9FUNG|nr:hypothetical protein HK100_004651 [Physocladia obscura]
MFDEKKRESRGDPRLDALTKRMQLLLSQIKTSTDAGANLLELKQQEEYQKYNYPYLLDDPSFFGSIPYGAPLKPHHRRQSSNGAISFNAINATQTYASSSSSRTAVNITTPPVFFSCSDSPLSSPSFGFHQDTPFLDYYYPQHVDNIPTPPTDTILRPVDANFDTSLLSPPKALSTTEAAVSASKQATQSDHHCCVPKRLHVPNISEKIIHSNLSGSEINASSWTIPLPPRTHEKSDDSIQIIDEPAYLMIGRPASVASTTRSRSSSFGSSKAPEGAQAAVAESAGVGRSFRIHHYESAHRRRWTKTASRMRRRRHTEIVVHAPMESAIYSASQSIQFGVAGASADSIGKSGGGGNVTNCSWWTWLCGGGRRRGDRWEKRGKGVGVWVGKDAKRVMTIGSFHVLPQYSCESPVRIGTEDENSGQHMNPRSGRNACNLALNRPKSTAFSTTKVDSSDAVGGCARSFSLSFRRLWTKERLPNSLNVGEISDPQRQLCGNPQLMVVRKMLHAPENYLILPYCSDKSKSQDFVRRTSLYSSSSYPSAPSIRWSTTTDEDDVSNSNAQQLSELSNSRFGKINESDGDGVGLVGTTTTIADEREIVYVGNSSQNKKLAFRQSGGWWNHPGVVGRNLATGSVGVF